MALTLPVGRSAPPQADGGHWYDRNGLPCYQQNTKAGGVRPTDVRDARKLGLVPSVTTVLSVLAKDALTTWKVKQGILAALTLTREPGESDDDFIDRVVADSKEQAKAAAEEGTRIHDACEAYFKEGYPKDGPYYEHVQGAVAEIHRLFPDVTDWVAEESFAHPLGFGGKIDLHSPSTGITVDYKGKDGDFSDGKKLAYDQNFQLGAYQRGKCLPRNVCANIFVSRTHPGKATSHLWKAEEVDYGWSVFESALETWKRLKKFDSGFHLQAQAA